MENSKSKLSYYSIFFLLLLYKEGFSFSYLSKESYSSNVYTTLEELGLIEFNYIGKKKKTLILLTDKGVTFIRDNFFEWCSFVYMFNLRPMLVVNDVVHISQDLQNNPKCSYVIEPYTSISKGTYKIVKILADTLHLSRSSAILPIGVRLYECRRHLKIEMGNFSNIDKELRKRVGLLSVKVLTTKLLAAGADNFEVISFMEKLKEREVAKERLIMGENTILIKKGYR